MTQLVALYETLAELVEESGITKTVIAQATGKSVGMVSLMLNGKRSIPKAFLRQVCEMLCLSEPMRERLFEQCDREQMGSLYDQHMQVCKLIKNIARTEYSLGRALPIHYSEPSESYGASQTLNNAYEISKLLSSLFSDAHVKGEPFNVKICCPLDYTALFDLIGRYHALGARFTVDHIVKLEQRTSDGVLRNLELITKLIPFSYFARNYYNAYYYYASSPELDDIYNPYPYYVIIDGKLVLLSRYFADAILIVEPAVVGGFEASFNYCADTGHNFCRPLVTYSNSTDDIYSYFAKHIMSGAEQASFSQVVLSTPPLCPVFTPEEIAMHARTDVPGIAELADKLVDLRHIVTEAEPEGSCLFLFSLEGLDRFLETGETIEYPPAILAPFSPEERLRLLDTYMELVRGENNYCVADSSRLLIPANIIMRTLYGGTVDFLLYEATVDHPYGMTTITLAEKSIYSAVRSFCEFVPDSNLILSSNDAYECLLRRREIFVKRHGLE